MALFIFISGYFYKPEKEDNIMGKEGYLWKKVKRLVIPYFIWNLLYGIIGMVLRHFGVISFGKDISFTTLFIQPWQDGHQYIFNLASWFLLALFLVNIVYLLLRKGMTKARIWNDTIMLIVLAIFAYFSIEIGKQNTKLEMIPLIRTGFFMFFYHLGYYYKTKIEGNYKINTICYLMTLIIIQLILIKVDSQISYYPHNMVFKAKYAIVPFLTNITGILFWLKVTQIVTPLLGTNKIVNVIGNNTYDIMLHHLFWVFLMNTVIRIGAQILGLQGFDINQYKHTIYYFYTAGVPQVKIVYFIIALGGPLIANCGYKKIKKQIKRLGTVKWKKYKYCYLLTMEKST